MKLAGKAAIVTGAGRNIGEEIAVLFAQEGAKVAVVGRTAAGLATARAARTVGAGRALRSKLRSRAPFTEFEE